MLSFGGFAQEFPTPRLEKQYLHALRFVSILGLIAGAATMASAQTGRDQLVPIVSGAATSTAAAEPLPTPPSARNRDPAKFKRFDSLIEPGPTTSFPGSIDSILGDAGGFRKWLADRDIGFQARISASVVQDLLPTGQPRSPQRFNGQRFTLQSHATVVTLTFGLQSIGLPNSKIVAAGTYDVTSYKPDGPSTGSIRTLAYYQSFADGKVAIKLGWIPNYYEFVGLFTGGSPVLSSGLSGLIPIQVGLSADPTSTPSANIYFTAKSGAYARFAVQRSVSPQGSLEEVRRNGIGLAFAMRGSGPLTIGEVGIKRPASLDHHQIWLRAGAIYNDSDYSRFDKRGTASNKAAYAAADYQLTQIDKGKPFRGFYFGGSAFWAPAKVNVFTQTFEARAYSVGLFNARPSDSITLRMTYSKFSRQAAEANRQIGVFANPNQIAGTLGYSLHAGPGIYIVPSIAYIHHPAFVGDYKDALAATGAVYLVL